MRVRTFTVSEGAGRCRAYLALLRYHIQHTAEFAQHDHSRVVNEVIPALERRGIVPAREASILEIGSGQRPGATMVLAAHASHVVGIDYDLTEPRSSPSGLLRLARRNGVERAAKTLGRYVLFDRRYYASLERAAGERLRDLNLDLRAMDACALDFPDASFDYVVSNAVFEHIDSIDAATAEMYRVLRNGGLARIVVHLFPSLSGGHRMEWAFPDIDPSSTIPPWDHLRVRHFPPHVYLNQLREADYLSSFSSRFVIVDKSNDWEGHRFLTAEIRAQLPQYSEEDLLKRTLTVTLRKN